MNLRVFYLYKTVGFGWLRFNTALIKIRLVSIRRLAFNWSRPRRDRLCSQARPPLLPDVTASAPRRDRLCFLVRQKV